MMHELLNFYIVFILFLLQFCTDCIYVLYLFLALKKMEKLYIFPAEKSILFCAVFLDSILMRHNLNGQLYYLLRSVGIYSY